jgi:hypothetical protein
MAVRQVKLREDQEYLLSGEGMLRAEPFMPGGSAFQIRNLWQLPDTRNSFYVRLTGGSSVNTHVVHK